MPVESELLHLRVPLCWAGDPALTVAPVPPTPRRLAQPFHFKKPSSFTFS